MRPARVPALSLMRGFWGAKHSACSFFSRPSCRCHRIFGFGSIAIGAPTAPAWPGQAPNNLRVSSQACGWFSLFDPVPRAAAKLECVNPSDASEWGELIVVLRANRDFNPFMVQRLEGRHGARARLPLIALFLPKSRLHKTAAVNG